MDRNKEKDHTIDDINLRPYKSPQILQSQINPKIHSIFIHPDMCKPNVVSYKASIANRAHLLHWHWNRGLLILKIVIVKNITLFIIKNNRRQQSSISWAKVEQIFMGQLASLWWGRKVGQIRGYSIDCE